MLKGWIGKYSEFYSKTCLKRPLKKMTKIGFQDGLWLNAGQKYCILQYFHPSLGYHLSLLKKIFVIPPANFVCRGYTVFTLSVRASIRPSVRPSVTLCFLNNSKSHCWIFIKPCKHVHICKTNTLDKKVRARGQFYKSYFPL